MMQETEFSPSEGSDAGKLFVIRPFRAFAGDRWARKVIRALADAGTKLPESALNLGMAGLAGLGMGLFGKMEEQAVEEAFEGLLSCCLIKRDPSNPALPPAPLLEADITDPATLSVLRTEAFKVNVGFMKAAAGQISPLVAALLPATPSKKETSKSQPEQKT
ncbi:hypothetical protein E3E12_07925 [Formicincola oecophyllae]|uniref:Uncharacterized protein n=1 Tax=Formicincola oecophyllae TaxID=2558361 RepID=A0A4Y6U9H3_9PROT|nr:hypothetical protein [Formicincola oecophyllae]QDH14123.1 hypothetical protein E3E12_07925 [Formicincola oecophyllae]